MPQEPASQAAGTSAGGTSPTRIPQERQGRRTHRRQPAQPCLHADLTDQRLNWSECREAFLLPLDSLHHRTFAPPRVAFLATIVPTNPNFTPPERNRVVAMNDLIRRWRGRRSCAGGPPRRSRRSLTSPALRRLGAPNDQGLRHHRRRVLRPSPAAGLDSCRGAKAIGAWAGHPFRPRSDPDRTSREERSVGSH
jgi:hypothetical protein